MIEIYVTHYATDALPGYNDILIDCVEDIRDATFWDGIDYRIVVPYWTDSAEIERDLVERTPEYVDLVRCDSGVQPYLMNRATALAKARGAELFVCLHNDIRCSRGWLRNIVSDVRAAETIHGRGNVIATPRYLPYHWLEPSTRALKHPAFWDRIRPPREASVIDAPAMRAWCKQFGFVFDGPDVERPRVTSPSKSYTTDDGHQLMMYCAAPEFFDEIGGCDESFTAKNFGDCDWGIRALMAGKKNLMSQESLLGHVQGLTFFNPIFDRYGDNSARFIAKWGQALFDEMQTGAIWPRLHREQLGLG